VETLSGVPIDVSTAANMFLDSGMKETRFLLLRVGAANCPNREDEKTIT